MAPSLDSVVALALMLLHDVLPPRACKVASRRMLGPRRVGILRRDGCHRVVARVAELLPYRRIDDLLRNLQAPGGAPATAVSCRPGAEPSSGRCDIRLHPELQALPIELVHGLGPDPAGVTSVHHEREVGVSPDPSRLSVRPRRLSWPCRPPNMSRFVSPRGLNYLKLSSIGVPHQRPPVPSQNPGTSPHSPLQRLPLHRGGPYGAVAAAKHRSPRQGSCGNVQTRGGGSQMPIGFVRQGHMEVLPRSLNMT